MKYLIAFIGTLLILMSVIGICFLVKSFPTAMFIVLILGALLGIFIFILEALE